MKAAADLAKQVITLATGAVAFTVTFLEKFTVKPEHGTLIVPKSLYVAWVLFGLSILFALWTLMGITGTLDALDRKAHGWPLTPAQAAAAGGAGGQARFPALLMLAAFVSAVVAMMWAGARLH